MPDSRRRFSKSAVAVGGVALRRRAGAWSDSHLDVANPLRTVALNPAPASQGLQADPRLPTQAEVDRWYPNRRNCGSGRERASGFDPVLRRWLSASPERGPGCGPSRTPTGGLVRSSRIILASARKGHPE